MISTMYVPLIVIRPSKFAIPYTVGNLMSIGSTGFLVGPCRQIKSMFDSTRMIGSIIFFSSMIGTLYFAFMLKSGVGVITCVTIQFAAYLWYIACKLLYIFLYLRDPLSNNTTLSYATHPSLHTVW